MAAMIGPSVAQAAPTCHGPVNHLTIVDHSGPPTLWLVDMVADCASGQTFFWWIQSSPTQNGTYTNASIQHTYICDSSCNGINHIGLGDVSLSCSRSDWYRVHATWANGGSNAGVPWSGSTGTGGGC
jgi:hypothetical protein